MINSSTMLVCRLLYGLLIVAILLLLVASLGVGTMLWFVSRVPPGVFALFAPAAGASFATLGLGSFGGRAAFCVVMLENLLVSLVVATMLLRILGSAMRGQAFVAANVVRLRVMAGAYAVSMIARFILPLIVSAPFEAWLQARGWSFNISPLLGLLVALVLAEVFRQGLRLREDVEMTV